MERKLFQKKDIIIVAVLLCVALFVFFGIKKDTGERAEIWIKGELYRTYDLNEPFELSLDNEIVIKGNGSEAWFHHSDCPDKVCINTGKLHISGEWAACLPNETVLKIVKDNGDVDTVS
ncbi:MAG: NusG domain II-containing protein [Ruminococcaceae bacterium]|nr:NusG domain II-containing protein [Oscillospiraceae bacterium]